MTVYSFHIFDRTGRCLLNREWKRPKSSSLTEQEEEKLLFGMVHTIKTFMDTMSPVDGKNGFKFAGSYSTNKYKLHFYETPTGLHFLMTTDVTVGSITESLKRIYSTVYVSYAVRNPLVDLSNSIDSELFLSKLDELVTTLPFFSQR